MPIRRPRAVLVPAPEPVVEADPAPVTVTAEQVRRAAMTVLTMAPRDRLATKTVLDDYLDIVGVGR